MNRVTRDDTEHGVEYVRADEAEAEIESIQDGADADKVIIQYHEATIKRLQAQIDMLNRALNAWHEKTDWMQETAQPMELGMHRADVLKQRIERLKASIALDKKSDNARELGLSYDDAVKGGVGIMLGGKRIDPASIYADAPPKQDVPETNFGNITEPKIGCVNHDCDKCKAVQEPVTHQDWCASLTQLLLSNPPQPAPCNCKQPAPQPVPVKTYHDGKPWPVAPKPWVGLTDEEMEKLSVENGKATFLNDDEETDILWFDGDCFALLKAAEAKLKEKNT